MKARTLAIALLGIAIGPGALAQTQARIYYDQAMVPHVFGDDDEAAFYALGFHHMMEYPVGTLNMLWLYSGRMSEIAGPSYLDEDRLIRLWEVPKIATRHKQELLAQGLFPLIKAYVAGIEDGRAWWRENGAPSASSRLDALVGPASEIFVDPVPDYLNQAFSPFGTYNDPVVTQRIRKVVNRLFKSGNRVTPNHVMRLGVAVNSYFLLHGNPFPADLLPPVPITPPPLPEIEVEPLNETVLPAASNGWLISPLATLDGRVSTLLDNHVALNRLHVRPYVVQIQGDQYQATGMTMPGYPGVFEGFNEGISWMFTAPVDGGAVAHNRWKVRLNSTKLFGSFVFNFEHNGFTEPWPLEKVFRTIKYWDWDARKIKKHYDKNFYVPVHYDESPDLGFTRYPVIPEDTEGPKRNKEVFFEQAAFTTERSPWEWMIRMGRARNATTDVDAILADGMLIFGNGNNFLVADGAGMFRYLYMVRVPEQGTEVPAASYAESEELDGARLGWRWQGYHSLSELPQIGPASVAQSNEVWINNNVTPDHVEELRMTVGDLAAFPAYMGVSTSTSSWRQERAVELLRESTTLIDLPDALAAATDKTFNWMHRMWPFFDTARLQVPGGVSANATSFMTWMEEKRGLDELDLPNAEYDFVAHVFSEATVYGALLRSHYQDEMSRLEGQARVTAVQAGFGNDPLHSLFDAPAGFTYLAYAPNMDAMAFALESVSTSWIEGSAALGLANQGFLDSISALIPDDPWGDPRYSTPIDPSWAGTIGGTHVTRWGHVSVLPLTPHYIAPPKASTILGLGGDPVEITQGYAYTGFYPPLLTTLSFPTLKLPLYGHTPRVCPMPGTDDSLFRTMHAPLFKDPDPVGHQEAVYPWTAGQSLFYHPQTSGSQVVLSVALPDLVGEAPTAKLLIAIGGTELTQPDVTGEGTLGYQDRFAPTKDFGAHLWHDLKTRENELGSPVHQLVVP